MAWTDPSTHIFVTGEILTASTMNTFLKDNLLDLDRRTSSFSASVLPGHTTTSTGYVGLTGPAVSVTVGSTGKALVSIKGLLKSDNTAFGAWMSVAFSGATTANAVDAWAINYTPSVANAGAAMGATMLFLTLNPGLTTVTTQYRVQDAGGGTVVTGSFFDRILTVTPLGA